MALLRSIGIGPVSAEFLPLLGVTTKERFPETTAFSTHGSTAVDAHSTIRKELLRCREPTLSSTWDDSLAANSNRDVIE